MFMFTPETLALVVFPLSSYFLNSLYQHKLVRVCSSTTAPKRESRCGATRVLQLLEMRIFEHILLHFDEITKIRDKKRRLKIERANMSVPVFRNLTSKLHRKILRDD